MAGKHISWASSSSSSEKLIGPGPPLTTEHSFPASHGHDSRICPPDAATPLHMRCKASPSGSSYLGSESSFSKHPLFSFRDGTSSRSSPSRSQSPDTDLEYPPKPVVESKSSQSHTGPPLGMGNSEDYSGPTRASIRAWAEATPAGPPNGPSMQGTRNLNTPDLLQRVLENNPSRASPSCIRDSPVPAGSSIGSSSGGSSDRSSASGIPSDEHTYFSGQHELADPHSRPHESLSQREPVPPADCHLLTPHEQSSPFADASRNTQLQSPPRFTPDSHSSSDFSGLASAILPSPTSTPAPAPAHLDQQQERVDHRHHHHYQRHHRHLSGRRRHRDRDRDRDREKKRSDLPAHQVGVVSMPALPPLRPLRPPPPPLPVLSLRTLPVTGPVSSDADVGEDVLDGIANLLKTSRGPVLRTTGDIDRGRSDAGWLPFPVGGPTGSSGASGAPSSGKKVEDDVLDDIRRFVQLRSRAFVGER